MIKKRLPFRDMSLAALCISFAVCCCVTILTTLLAAFWWGSEIFIAETYGASLRLAVDSICFPAGTDNQDQLISQKLREIAPDMDCTYFLVTTSGSSICSGYVGENPLPFSEQAGRLVKESSRVTYTDTYRGRILGIGANPNTDSRLIVLYPYSDFYTAGDLIGAAVMPLLLLALLLLSIMLFILQRYYLSPAKALVVTMHSPSMNETITPYTHWKNDIGRMCSAYLDRYHEYQRSLREIEDLNAARRESELDVLQNQINAHFIYNTLNNIQWLASANRMDDVISTAQALDILLRGCARNDSDYVRMEDEIAYVDAYLSAQKIRFQDLFDYDFQIDPLLLMTMVPKFIIQPLVENSIYHGFLDAHRKNGSIRIQVSRRGHRVLISVTDNGIGIPEECIFGILNNTQKSSGHYMGVAIGNINKRIHLLCGREYGIGIQSKEGSYTKVEITLPIME